MTEKTPNIDHMADLRRQGYSIREISVALTEQGTPLSPAAVSRHLRRAGVVGDETSTLEATTARIAKARAQTYDRVLALLEDAEAARERVYAPYQQVVSTPEGAEIITLQEPPLGEAAKLLTTIERLITQATRLLDQVRGDDTEKATSLLMQLHVGIKQVVEQYDAETGRTVGADNDAYNYDSDYSVYTDPEQQA